MRKNPEPDISFTRFLAYFIVIVGIVVLAIIVFNETIVKPAEEYNQRTLTKQN